MATSPFGGFANLQPAQIELAQRRAATVNPLEALIQGFTQGQQLQQLPNQLAQQALNAQLAEAVQRAKLQELGQGKIIEVGGRLVRVNPQTGGVDVVLDAQQNSNKQFVGFSGGKPVLFDPRAGAISVAEVPTGIDLTGGLAPKTVAPETFSTVVTDQGIMTRGNRSTTATPLTIGGEVAQTPTKSTNVRQFTDAQGNLFEQPLTGGAATAVLNPLTGAQMNTGIANQIIATDQGIFTAPKKTEGGAPSTSPTALTTPAGTPLTRTSGGKGAAATQASSEYTEELTRRNMESVTDLKGRVGMDTVGIAAMTGAVPGTPAADFKADLDTLKANIAFGALQQMRNASKTGGALGQVSDKEGRLLQSTLGALDTNQSPANFRKNLDKIEASIKRFQEAQAKSARVSSPVATPSINPNAPAAVRSGNTFEILP